MIFSVSKVSIEGFLDFGPDSVTLIVTDLLTINSHGILTAAWSSQGEEFSNTHPARVPISANQEGTMEMGNEVLSSVGAQYMDTSGYQLSDLDDTEFQW